MAKTSETSETKTIRIRQVRSEIGTPRKHRETLKSLGLRRIRHEVERQDTPGVRGAVAKIRHLVEILEDES
jgi:large subunit ribosomal protein L30